MIFARGATDAAIDAPAWWGSVPTWIAVAIGAGVVLGMVAALVWCAVTAGARADKVPPRDDLIFGDFDAYRIGDEVIPVDEMPPPLVIVEGEFMFDDHGEELP